MYSSCSEDIVLLRSVCFTSGLVSSSVSLFCILGRHELAVRLAGFKVVSRHSGGLKKGSSSPG